MLKSGSDPSMVVLHYNRKMSIRSSLAFLSVLVLVSLLSGCPSDPQSSAQVDEAEQPPFPVGPAAAQESAQAEPPASGAPVPAPAEKEPAAEEVNNTLEQMLQSAEKPRSSYEGVAQNAKMGAVLVSEDGIRHWVELDAWPDAAVGKKVQVVAARETRYDLPVAKVGPNGEQSAGVVVEPGQTAEDAARREVLTELVWKISE